MNTIKYSYDTLGNLIALTYPGGKIVRYAYDAAGNLITVTDWADRVTGYEYDKNDRLVKTTRPNGTQQTITYNAAGHVLEQKDTDGAGNIINQYNYEYDATGKITVEQSTHEAAPYNLTNAVMTYGEGNRLLTYNGQAIEYDNDGNMTYGPLDGEMVKFTYDSRNRLVQAGNFVYEYDAENNRIAVIKDGLKTEYINDPNSYLSKLLIKKDADGTQTSYVYGLGLIGHEENDSYSTYHFDSRGSTTAITDEEGTVTDRFDYAPYGELVNHIGTTDTPFKYNGRDGVMTDDNGLYYMRARYYNPDIKRFINQDIISGSIDDGRTLNRYAYVNGDPVNLTDPFGLSPDLNPSRLVHGMLDLISMIDPFGIADVINAGLYFVEGDYVMAGISLACALIPAFFDAGVKGVKWAGNAFRATKAGQKLVQNTKVLNYASKVTNSLSRGLCKVRTTAIGKALTSRYAVDAVVGASVSAAGQQIFTGEIDWARVAKDATISVVAGKVSRMITGTPDFAGSICFTADTLIATKAGYRQIKDIKAGDEVYSADPETGKKG